MHALGLANQRCDTMYHMGRVGLRELRHNTAEVVARAEAGETVTITNRGRPVARMTRIPTSTRQELIQAGVLVPATGNIDDLPEPVEVQGVSVSEVLLAMREEDRER